MATLLYRVGHWIAGHRHVVFAAWLVVAAGLALALHSVGAETTNDVRLPGTDSQRATDLLAARFPPQQNGKSPIVFRLPDGAKGTVKDDPWGPAISRSVTAIRAVPEVNGATSPFSQAGSGQIAKDGQTAFTPVLMDVGNAALTEDEARAVLDAAEPARAAGMQVAAGGSIGSELSTPETETSELVGILGAMIILTLAFGSVVAMGMPILSALLGLIPALAVIGLLGHVVDIPSIAPTLGTMIGLGVGIDYALFVVARHRRQLADGVEMRESIARAIGTSGTAIVFAGTTVVLALVALAVARIPLVTALGWSSAIAVATAVLAAITFLPAVLAMVDHRINALALPAFLRPRPKPEGAGFWARWGTFVTTHPLWAMLIAVAVLIPLSIPVLTLDLGQEDVGATPTDTTERQAYDLMAAGFGVGYNGPFLIASSVSPPATAAPDVQTQEDELTSLQKQLEQEQKEGQEQQEELTAEADDLKADQAALLAQQSELEAEQADLQAQAASLEAQRADLQRQVDALRSEESGLRDRAAGLERERAGLRGEEGRIRERARGLEAEVQNLIRRARSLEGDARAARARASEIESAITGTSDRARRRELGAALESFRAREREARAEIGGLRSRASALPGQAAALRREAAGVRDRAPALREEAQAAVNRASELAARARPLAAEAESLARQGAALAAQGAELAAQGDALQAQADQLKARQAALEEQQDQLEQLQATAAAQQKQAKQLQDELTKELTKAGGDARGTDPRLVKLQDALTATAGVALVSPPQINKKGDAVVYTAIPTTAPAATETAGLVGVLRTTVLPEATAGSGLDASVGGSTPANVDLAADISSRLPVVIVVVLALSFLVLMVAFHSLLVPLQAALVNLLCVGAAFGVLTACFQWGWGIGLVGIDTARDTVPIASFVPLMMFAVLFGLSMDYQVFLLSQIAHHRSGGQDDRTAVRSAIGFSGKVIAAAALIMIGVFGSYILNGDPTVKQFGVGLSVAVALAATMVLLLAPALMVTLGRATWWFPSRLARVVPRVDIEGQGLLEKRRAAGAEAPAQDVEEPAPSGAA